MLVVFDTPEPKRAEQRRQPRKLINKLPRPASTQPTTVKTMQMQTISAHHTVSPLLSKSPTPLPPLQVVAHQAPALLTLHTSPSVTIPSMHPSHPFLNLPMRNNSLTRQAAPMALARTSLSVLATATRTATLLTTHMINGEAQCTTRASLLNSNSLSRAVLLQCD